MKKVNTKEILKKRLKKAKKHYEALKEYKEFINKMGDIYSIYMFNSLRVEERAILEAFLKRFASLQDYLGAKIFPLLLELAGISTSKMSEVLYYIEKEEIIDSFENWVELREIRNNLEHDYPDELEEALNDLKQCVESFDKIESYFLNSLEFFKKYTNEDI